MSGQHRDPCPERRVEFGKFIKGEDVSREFLLHYDSCKKCGDAFTAEFEREAKAHDPIMDRMRPLKQRRA